MKRFFRKLTLALGVALAMSLGIALPAKAATAPLDPVSIPLTKVLEMPPGTEAPDATFVFTITQMMEVPAGFSVHTSPTITVPNAVVNIVGTDWTTPSTPTATVADIFAGITWPSSGDFHFRIAEVPDTNTLDTGEHMTYSDQVFIVTVRVANCLYTGTFVPQYFVVWEDLVNVADVYIQDDAAKVDDIVFINQFTRDILGDPALIISKDVEGAFANLIDLYFPFIASLNIPQAALDRFEPFVIPTVAYIVSGDYDAGTLVTYGTVTFDILNPLSPNIIGAGFELRHGQRLEFFGLPAGTLFQVNEYQHPDYSGGVVVTINDNVISTVDRDVGVNISTYITDHYHYLGDAGRNVAAFTNVHFYSPLTGLMITSTPLLAALVVAALVLAIMVSSRSRRRIDQLADVYSY